MVRVLLESEGHEITPTESGWHGFTLCHLMAVDAVIVCLFMPDQTGTETLRDLRREFPDLPILAFARRTGVDVSEFGRWLGATRTLHKPCRPRELLAAIREVLGLEREEGLPGSAC